jgi:hypothetical protein
MLSQTIIKKYMCLMALTFFGMSTTISSNINVNNILTDTGFENGINGELYSNNSDWEVQRTGSDTSKFIVNRIESSESAFSGKKYCFMSLPKSADASKFEHITIGQLRKLEAGKIYEATIWVKWVNTKNGNSTAIISFWAQHMEDKTFAGKDCWLKNGEWTKLSFRFMAVKPNEPTFIYVSLLPHQTPQTTEILVDEFTCEIAETLSNIDSLNDTMVLKENFENEIGGTIPSKPWELTNPDKMVTGIIEQNNGNKFVTIKMPPKTNNYTAARLMRKINLSKGVLYDVNMSLKWNNSLLGYNSGIVNVGIYHTSSNTWWGPIDHIVKDGDWHDIPFLHGATYDGEYELYIQVFGWGNFGQPMDVSCDNFNVKVHN